jgi:transcriptional regulator with XRE-family HTH domain
MFPTFEIVKELCKKQGISLNTLEERIGFARNSLYSWKISEPKPKKLNAVADYFNVSTDFLLGRTDNPAVANNPEPSPLDLRKIAAGSMLFDGKPLSEEDIDFITAVLEAHLKNK